MARPSNKAARRMQIVKALMKVMAVHGYDGASMAQIAAEASLNTGLLHYHFNNKEEILISLLQELVNRHKEKLDALLLPSDSPDKNLDAFIDFHLGFGESANQDTLACWIIISGEAIRKHAVRKEYDTAMGDLISTLEAIINKGNESGGFSCASPRSCASALMAAIQGYYVISATCPGQIPQGSAAQCTKDMAKGLLGA